MYNIIPLIIILICLAAILAIVIKKLPLLAVFDVDSIPEEKEAETKKKIIEQRMDRRLKVISNKIKPFFELFLNFFQRKFKAGEDKIAKLEEQYKSKTKKEALVTKEEFQSLEKKIIQFLDEAQEFTKNEDYSLAEKKYIEILSLDAKNISAYRGLGNLYIEQQLYTEAIQTFKHILKLDKINSQAYFELAEVYIRQNDYNSAFNHVNKALEFEPVNPKYLDLLLTISIILNNKEMATDALERLKAVNPENAKIHEFEVKISQIK